MRLRERDVGEGREWVEWITECTQKIRGCVMGKIDEDDR